MKGITQFYNSEFLFNSDICDSQPEVTSEATVTTFPIGERTSTSQLQIVDQYDLGAMNVCL